MDGPGHLLSLKVMRISRPSLASAWEPFYSSSPSFSAHSTASILSLQGGTPLPGHPKTLRDFTAATELLTLPSSFGAIQLGETFSSCLCVNNEAHVDIDTVTLTVEMQTVTSKIMLAEFGGSEYKLVAGDTLENVVNHEIKELGQHVLACTVTYRLPPNARTPPGPAGDGNDPSLQAFRKFYKFVVTNPLSVKTKVHAAKSPSALLSAAEREKIFLEVHIQNMTQESMWFESVRFECAEAWDAEDGNIISDNGEDSVIFSGSMALMQPQDTRQYTYTLTPKTLSRIPILHPPGSIIPLGRLDISWRSSFGEPGRLLTSMLSRRIPLPPPLVQQPASALPSYLKRAIAVPAATPSRPRSPQLIQSRPGSPTAAHRSDSPFRNRPTTGPARPQSPSQPPVSTPAAEFEVSLVVLDIPRSSIAIEKPFAISFSLTISAPVSQSQRRTLTLVVQHVQSPRTIVTPSLVSHPADPFSPTLHSPGLSTPSPTSTPFNYALAHQKLLNASPRQHNTEDIGGDLGHSNVVEEGITLPPPFFEGPDELKFTKRTGVVFVGHSSTTLPPFELCGSPTEGEPVGQDQVAESDRKCHAVQQFKLSYLPLHTGFLTVGGLRVLLVEDKVVNDDGSLQDRGHEQREEMRKQSEVRILKEWEVIGEVWVRA